MLSIGDSLILVSITAIILIIVFVLGHFVAIRIGFEKGMLQDRLNIVVLIIGVIAWLILSNFIGFVTTATLANLPELITTSIIAVGFGIILLACCRGTVVGGAGPTPG